MKDELIFRRKFLSVLSVVLVGLLILSSHLYFDNRAYRQKNEELILQNDSLISVNIRLRADTGMIEKPRYSKQKPVRRVSNYE